MAFFCTNVFEWIKQTGKKSNPSFPLGTLQSIVLGESNQITWGVSNADMCEYLLMLLCGSLGVRYLASYLKRQDTTPLFGPSHIRPLYAETTRNGTCHRVYVMYVPIDSKGELICQLGPLGVGYYMDHDEKRAEGIIDLCSDITLTIATTILFLCPDLLLSRNGGQSIKKALVCPGEVEEWSFVFGIYQLMEKRNSNPSISKFSSIWTKMSLLQSVQHMKMTR